MDPFEANSLEDQVPQVQAILRTGYLLGENNIYEKKFAGSIFLIRNYNNEGWVWEQWFYGVDRQVYCWTSKDLFKHANETPDASIIEAEKHYKCFYTPSMY